MTYQNRMESSEPRDDRLFTVRKGLSAKCPVTGKVYRTGDLVRGDDPVRMAQGHRFVQAPAHLLKHAPDKPVPRATPPPVPDPEPDPEPEDTEDDAE